MIDLNFLNRKMNRPSSTSVSQKGLLYRNTATTQHITKSIHCEATRRCGFLLRAGLIEEVKIFSLFVRLMQVQRLHSCHETCRKEQVCVPSVQSQDIASCWWLGDIEKMERKMLGAFSSHFLNVGYS